MKGGLHDVDSGDIMRHLGEMEMKMAQMIWENEPMPSKDLVKQCEERFNWKKSTTFTMLKRLCERGLFVNNKALITSLISEEEWKRGKSEEFLNETYEGSLPMFVAAFTKKKKLKKEDVEALRKLINEYEEE